jgi:hypothetical protein
MEWLLLLPKLGFLPQITHTLDICRSSLFELPALKECHSMPQARLV